MLGCRDEVAMALQKMTVMTHLKKSVKSDWDDNGRFASTADFDLVFV